MMPTRCQTLLLVSTFMLANFTGCATVLSGTSAEVKIQAKPKNAHFVVLGGEVGKILVKGKRKSALIKRVLRLFKPHLDQESYRLLRQVNLTDLMTLLAFAAERYHVPELATHEVMPILKRVPKPVLRKALSTIDISAIGQAPQRVELDTGQAYVVIGYAPDHKIRVKEIKTSLNGYVFLNILNLGIGALIDLGTGAYREIDSAKIKLVMPKRSGRP